MLARLHVLLPFWLHVPVEETFPVYEYIEDGYGVRVLLPVKTDVPASAGTADEVLINGRPAVSCNGLRIDFYKEEFDRTVTQECDPPYEFMAEAVNSFLARLRYVTRAPKVRPIAFPQVPWRLEYLNDDGTELEKQEGLPRVRGAIKFSFEYIGLTKQVWDNIRELDTDFQCPAWDDLLLDAYDMLPQIGPALVLAVTALEVFIGDVLDKLAKRSSVPEKIRNRLNERDWRKAPSLDEQFDVLLGFLLGYSLKEDLKLWEGVMNLRSARNSFVHEGVAKVGGNPITDQDARWLLDTVDKVVRTVRKRLPKELQWREFKHATKVSARWRLLKEESDEAT